MRLSLKRHLIHHQPCWLRALFLLPSNERHLLTCIDCIGKLASPFFTIYNQNIVVLDDTQSDATIYLIGKLFKRILKFLYYR